LRRAWLEKVSGSRIKGEGGLLRPVLTTSLPCQTIATMGPDPISTVTQILSTIHTLNKTTISFHLQPEKHTRGRMVSTKDPRLNVNHFHKLNHTMLLQMFLRGLDLFQCNQFESISANVTLLQRYPLFSNRPMISPTRPRMTPSGLTAMKVCSEDIVGWIEDCLDGLKSAVNSNACGEVRRVKSKSEKVTRRKSLGMS